VATAWVAASQFVKKNTELIYLKFVSSNKAALFI
jgi:hypothetical protein